jgi:hypothetical protein
MFYILCSGLRAGLLKGFTGRIEMAYVRGASMLEVKESRFLTSFGMTVFLDAVDNGYIQAFERSAGEDFRI